MLTGMWPELTGPVATWPTEAVWIVAEGLDRVEVAGLLGTGTPAELLFVRCCSVLAGRWGMGDQLLGIVAGCDEDSPTLLRMLRAAHDRRRQ